MTVSSPTVQQSSGSVPITNVQPPPEGQMAASVNVVLTPGDNTFSNTFQLSSQSGLMLSQVVTLCIDNSQNLYPLLVTHGALAEVIQVAALSTVIVPTFSARAGGYPLQIVALENAVPTVNLDIDVIFMNYPRPPGTFSATNQQTIVATGQNTNVLSASVQIFTPGAPSVVLLAAGNYILDSLDFAMEGFIPTAAGQCSFVFSLQSGPQIVQQHFLLTTPAAGGAWLPGGNQNCAGSRTWPQGLLLGRGRNLVANIVSIVNLSDAYLRINLSGVKTP